jgi:hypothetical protein
MAAGSPLPDKPVPPRGTALRRRTKKGNWTKETKPTRTEDADTGTEEERRRTQKEDEAASPERQQQQQHSPKLKRTTLSLPPHTTPLHCAVPSPSPSPSPSLFSRRLKQLACTHPILPSHLHLCFCRGPLKHRSHHLNLVSPAITTTTTCLAHPIYSGTHLIVFLELRLAVKERFPVHVWS